MAVNVESSVEIPCHSTTRKLIQRDGIWGWIVTFASLMTISFTSGILYSSGLLLSEIVQISGEPVAKVAWILSIMNALQMMTGK